MTYFSFHLCPHCKLVCKTNKDKDDSKKHARLRQRGKLVLMFGCKWKVEVAQLGHLKTSSFHNVMQRRCTEQELIDGIARGDLFGFLMCDVTSTDDFIKAKLHLNFPPIIQNLEVEEDMMSPYMRSRCKNRSFPIKTLLQTFNGTQMLLFTPLVRFYMELGLRISNISYFIQYEPSFCLKKFTQKVTQMRMAADYENNKEKSVTAKLVGNRYVYIFQYYIQ